MRRPWIHLLSLLFALGAVGCTPEEPADDDDTTGDDDDSAVGDDDDSTNDPPVFLNSYDFRLVQLENGQSSTFSYVRGQMDVYVSSTVFRAEMTTESGLEWEWLGPLVVNQESFEVTGEMEVPGVDPFWVTVAGNFLADADQSPSRTCLTGIADDNELFNGGVDLGMQFAWYACEEGAGAPAIDRTGSYSITPTVHADNCGAWSAGAWNETWAFDGRLLVVTRNSSTGYGIVSDDGNVFRYSMIESADPGVSLKVIGDFTSPTGQQEARATGYCVDNTSGGPGAVIDLDYP